MMNPRRAGRLVSFLTVVGVVLIGLAPAATPAAAQGSPNPPGPPPLPSAVPVCPGPAAPGTTRCHSHVRIDPQGKPFVTTTPAGYRPIDLQSAYSLPSNTAGVGQTVAIVDAFNNPNAESDLAVYRDQFGLPPCTTANGCFRKVNQDGNSFPLPRRNSNWGLEIALDLDMVSAICPNCKILLVEARDNSISNLGVAVNTAARLGAVAISNSYGASEGSWVTNSVYASPYDHPGVAVTASSGDNGYGVEFPADLRYVTGVGGTSLTKSGTTWSEVVWSGAGSGCSAHISKPNWQTDGSCGKRTVADVSAVADPNTGVAVYDTFGYGGWLVVGGTSAGSPIIASVYALAGNTSSITYGSYPYGHTSSLNDVTSGSNGSCGGSYLCTGTSGYDGPSGLGTPNGTAGF